MIRILRRRLTRAFSSRSDVAIKHNVQEVV
jgi:hypothetical protein